MFENDTLKAVIYCRVSSVKQVAKGDGINSQETQCREYAKEKGYEVVQVFRDKGISGKLVDRPSMNALLKFLKKSKHPYVVIIDDISRLARDMGAYITLRAAIGAEGGILESPSMEFGDEDDPENKLKEYILASFSEYHRLRNRLQVNSRTSARLMNGYWTFRAPWGYRHEEVKGHRGKLLVRDEPLASIIQEALEGYASGRFETQSEVKNFLESTEEFPKDSYGEVHFQRVHNLLNRIVYAGYIDRPERDIILQPAQHEPLISFETWKAIQDRLKGKGKAPARKDLNEDFPLRGFVTCGCCNKPMTSCWSAGRYKKYPYYLCRSKTCPEKGKSVRKELLEGQFEELLKSLRPSQDLFSLAQKLFQEHWGNRMQKSTQQVDHMKAEIKKIERKVDQYLDLIGDAVDAENKTLIRSYEKKVRTLEENKVSLSEKIKNCGRPLKSHEEVFRTAFGFLSNPCKLWTSDRLEDKRKVLRLAFAEKLAYYRNQGFRTAPTSLPFRVLEGLKGGQYVMVSREGIEPSTY